MVDISDHVLIIMIIVCTTFLLSFFIMCVLCLKSCDTSEEYREDDGIYGNHGPIEQNIPLASIQNIIENHNFLQNEHVLRRGILRYIFSYSVYLIHFTP